MRSVLYTGPMRTSAQLYRVPLVLAPSGPVRSQPNLQTEPTGDRFKASSADVVGLLAGVSASAPPTRCEPLPNPNWPPADDLDRLVLLYEMGRFDELREVESALLQ